MEAMHVFQPALKKKIQHSLSPLWVGQSILIQGVQSKHWTKIGVIISTGKHGDYIPTSPWQRSYFPNSTQVKFLSRSCTHMIVAVQQASSEY